MRTKTIGILGGMGPASTVDLFDRIVKLTPAKKDQEHLRVIIDNNPAIPDRTLGILGKGKNPLGELVRTARNLQKAGVDFIVIPCNTAHFYYDALKESVDIPVINMISVLSKYMQKHHPGIRRIGLIATTGTIESKIFNRFLKNVDIMVPSSELQKSVMAVVYGKKGIKAGFIGSGHKKKISDVIKYLVQNGCQAVIFGCTELSLLLSGNGRINVSIPIFDPLQILAQVSIKKAWNGDSARHG